MIITLLLILAVGPGVTLGADGEVRRRGTPVDRCPAGPAPPVNGRQWSCWKPVRLLWRRACRTGGETLAAFLYYPYNCAKHKYRDKKNWQWKHLYSEKPLKYR